MSAPFHGSTVFPTLSWQALTQEATAPLGYILWFCMFPEPSCTVGSKMIGKAESGVSARNLRSSFNCSFTMPLSLTVVMVGLAAASSVPCMSVTTGAASDPFFGSRPLGASPPPGVASSSAPPVENSNVSVTGRRLRIRSSLTSIGVTWYRRSTPGHASG